MKWALIVWVAGVSMIETDLVFDTLDECLRAEQTMRNESSRVYNDWLTWAKKNPVESNYPKSQEFMKMRFGLLNVATCIPTNK